MFYQFAGSNASYISLLFNGLGFFWEFDHIKDYFGWGIVLHSILVKSGMKIFYTVLSI
jgi:hypothetical protein